MQYTRDTAIAKLLESYRAYFNIIMFEEEQKPLTAICEFLNILRSSCFPEKLNCGQQTVKNLYIYLMWSI